MERAAYGETFDSWFANNEFATQPAKGPMKSAWQAAVESRKFACERKLLDHGYIRYVEHWGRGDAEVDEAGIVEAARQSTQGSFRGWERDRKLLEHLFCSKPQHSTPFEFAGLVVEAQMPMWVIREWHRHRTQSYNEMSARYEPLPNLNYVPTYERCKQFSSTNKQAGLAEGAAELTPLSYAAWKVDLEKHYEDGEALYRSGLAAGIPKELARNALPLGRYTRMRAQGNLRNWLAFVTLRSDAKAAWEIQEYSRAVEVMLQQLFPRTYALFDTLRSEQLQ